MSRNISFRKFKVIGFEAGHEVNLEYTLNKLLSDDGTEVLYTLQEEIDNILNLREGESHFVSLNRGNQDSKGIILRTQ